MNKSELSALSELFLKYSLYGGIISKKGLKEGEFIRPFYFIKTTDKGPQSSNADGQCLIAHELSQRLCVQTWKMLLERHPQFMLTKNGELATIPFPGQTCGSEFQNLVVWYLQKTFVENLGVLRPNSFNIITEKQLREFEQYSYLNDFYSALRFIPPSESCLKNRLDAAFSSYAVKADIIITLGRITKEQINNALGASKQASKNSLFVADSEATSSPIILGNRPSESPLLHAIISVKWTIRSDRAQNARTEGSFAVQQRRGKAPHFVVVTGEPKPSRIRSIAIGADVDCVYHAFLPHLISVIDGLAKEFPKEKQINSEKEWIDRMLDMNLLRDISDLPFDLLM